MAILFAHGLLLLMVGAMTSPAQNLPRNTQVVSSSLGGPILIDPDMPGVETGVPGLIEPGPARHEERLDWNGSWKTTYGQLRLIQEGKRVYGDYHVRGIIEGRISDNGSRMRGLFQYPDGRWGTLEFRRDGEGFFGHWRWNGITSAGDQVWAGSRSSAKKVSLVEGLGEKREELKRQLLLRDKFADSGAAIGADEKPSEKALAQFIHFLPPPGVDKRQGGSSVTLPAASVDAAPALSANRQPSLPRPVASSVRLSALAWQPVAVSANSGSKCGAVSTGKAVTTAPGRTDDSKFALIIPRAIDLETIRQKAIELERVDQNQMDVDGQASSEPLTAAMFRFFPE